MTLRRAVDGRKLIIGVVHLAPLPGTPFYERGSFERTLATALESARVLADCGADGCLLQTVDRVYSTDETCDPARLAAVAIIAHAVRGAADDRFEVGVQIMRNALRASLAAAHLARGSFIRVGALVGATLSTHGIVQPDSLGLMAYRRALDAQEVSVIADISSMHFQWLTADRGVPEVAAAAKTVGADAVAISAPDADRLKSEIRQVRAAAPDLSVLIAGFTTPDNAADLLAHADGAFVGRSIETAPFSGRIDPQRTREYMRAARSA